MPLSPTNPKPSKKAFDPAISPVSAVPLGDTVLPDNIGHDHAPSATVQVEIGVRFLEHFSEQLYSSPQKAFEELISNGWDAGADYVDVRLSSNLHEPLATMCVLDNGSSMDAKGLAALWRIASSSKKKNSEYNGRHVVGKFGIGKLATYVLAQKLTYICKAADGIIRRVTMDYSDIGGESDEEDLISKKPLSVYEVSIDEVKEALSNIDFGSAIIDLLETGVPKPAEALVDDEFGAPKVASTRPIAGTWTLVVLSDLKPTGQNLKLWVLRRMLEAALPMGSEMAIKLNGRILTSTKIDLPVITGCDWQIGSELTFTEIEIDEDEVEDEEMDEESSTPDPSKVKAPAKASTKERLTITTGIQQVGSISIPYVELPEVGRVTGRIRLFQERISGGKSEARGSSNGFLVNVLGRVVNQNDTSFGEENLSHASWARFRMTVRADGLNDCLTTNREQFKERRKLLIFRAFLRRAFNMARSKYDSDANAAMPDGGDVLVKSLGVLSLSPLRNVVSEVLKNRPTVLSLFDESGIQDRDEKAKSWQENTAEHIQNALGQVKYEKLSDDSFVKFRLSDNAILVNKEHPFVEEHSRSKAEKELVRTMAMVNLLTDVYALDIGVKPAVLENIIDYRERLMRFQSMKRRESGTHIARLLLKTQHTSDNSDLLEVVLADALRYLGFQVTFMAGNGEPEGIAKAYAFPPKVRHAPTRDEPNPALYSVSFDAKASKHLRAKTGNIKLDGVTQHRKKHNATYALVVAPGFQDGSLDERCEEFKVTPMKAYDLGRLLELTVAYGALPITHLEEIFQLYNPEAVSAWIDKLTEQVKTNRPLTIDIFLQALRDLRGQVPDAIAPDVIALECRRNLGAPTVLTTHVTDLARGLEILIPDLIGVGEDSKIVVNASPEHVAAAITSQLEKLRSADSTAA